MPIRERAILLKINEAVKRYTAPQPTTYAVSSGQIPPPNPLSSATNPLPILSQSQAQR